MGLALIGIVFGVLIPSASASMIVLFLGMGICKGLDIKPYSNMAAGIIAMAGFAVVCAQHYLYSKIISILTPFKFSFLPTLMKGR